MKKTLLAAALLAGFATAGVAQAETSVTLYGIVDTGYGYSNYKYDRDGFQATSKSSGLVSGIVNGNRWGLKGSEDLGDGLRAIFQLEQGFDLGTGAPSSGKQFHRQSFVGLSSDNWGTFSMGRQYSAGVMAGDMNVNGWSLGDMDKVFGGVGYGNRIDNSFKYVTPDLSGFKFIALYGSSGSDRIDRIDGESYGGSERNSRVSVAATYANGPISGAASYDRQGTTNVEDSITSWHINGAYDFEVVKLSLAFGQDRNGKLGWGGNGGNFVNALGNAANLSAYNDLKTNNYHIGLSAPVGAGKLYAGVNYSTSNLDDGDKWGDDAGNLSTYQINYFYPLSKRTGVYTYATYGKNIGYVRDLKGTEAGVGLNHKF
ncbi:porin [Castellaniella sp.]|uniref:porin n=1 Tax=Castellaniella sp. TaxID=1955812 RepID=UPI002AFF3735|nr:porin [Castellaniella sp.]